MQFYWLSPLIILPLWVNWKYGIAWWSIIFSIVTGIQGWVTKACLKAPTSVFGAVTFVKNITGEEYRHIMEDRPAICGKSCVSSDFAPFLRAQPYLIGLLVGWVLYKTKGNKIKINHVSHVKKYNSYNHQNLILIIIF
jgi:hypothetical protein